MGRIFDSVLDLVGDTPLVPLRRVADGIDSRLYLKLEQLNPGGSIKDRIALAMIRAAEEAGELRAGGTVIEATAGNTGVGLAQVAASRGYRCVFVMPDKMSEEKEHLLAAYGAEIVRTRSDVPSDHPEAYKGVAARLAREIPGAWYADQFHNPENPRAHYRTTGPEIWRDTDGRVDVLVGGMGTTGSLCGGGRYLKEQRADVRVVAVDPVGSAYGGGEKGRYLVEGIGGDRLPEIYDREVIDEFVTLEDSEGFTMARRLAREEGILVGGSSGFAVAGALKLAARLPSPATIVVLVTDTGRNYLSKVHSDAWMRAHGFLDAGATGDGEVPSGQATASDRGEGGGEPGFATRAIHAGQPPDARTGAVIVPIQPSSTFVQDGIGRFRDGFEYSRTGNPTRRSLEQTLASIEGARHGLCFASGSAATTAVLDRLQPGNEVLTTIDVYGGTYRLFQRVFAKYGISFRFLATSDAEEILGQVSERTRMIWVETPTNPLLNVIDVSALGRGKPEGVTLAVDNTFASPFLQNPLALGADLVVHSATKYLGGHSDVVGGAVMTSDDGIAEALAFYQNAAGGVPSPFDCFLLQRGVKTLAVRMRQHEHNARAVAQRLEQSRRVSRVFFPGSPTHPHHELARRQMRGVPGMVSFRLAGGRAAVDAFFEKVRLFTLAESLGGVESLACYPYTMTHGAIPDAEKRRIGITDDLVRLSVGIESTDDLIRDLEQALG
jgi:cystathionine beta-synthase